MRIIFISDIHGNKDSLSFLRKERFDQLIVLGDVYSYGFEPDKDDDTIKELMNYKSKMICLKGNSDSDNQNLFTDVDTIKFTTDNHLFICNHGNKYNYHNASFLGEKAVLIYGHDHVPYIKEVDNMIYVCVGSLGKPRYATKPSYAVYEKGQIVLYSLDKEIINQVKIK